jgi:hypothetical protein
MLSTLRLQRNINNLSTLCGLFEPAFSECEMLIMAVEMDDLYDKR